MVILMYVLALLGVSAVVYMLMKKMDIKITLFVVGMLLGIAALLMKKVPVTSPNDYLYPIEMIVNQFKRTLPAAGFIILALGGYTAYMSFIGANDVTVDTLTKPLKGIKSVYILVPIVFLVGNLLSLVIPSASNLAIILLATLYPVLKKSGMSTLSAAAVIGTAATVMPTPLGGDNVVIAAELAEFFNITLTPSTYVFQYHAIVSIPTLLLMAVVHYFWQKYNDKKAIEKGIFDEPTEFETAKDLEIREGKAYRTMYTLLPLFPILLLLLSFFVNMFLKDGSKMEISVLSATFISFIVAVFCELIFNRKRKNNGTEVLKETEHFFKGMGNAMGIVVLLVAAGVFVQGIRDIGIIVHLQSVMETSTMPGFVLPLILIAITAVIVVISGSGVALFYAMAPLMAPLAAAAGISALAITVPMGLAGNLLRAVSPVSAVIIIIAAHTKKSPIDIVKRTAVPMLAGVVFMFVLSMILFLSGIVALPV